MSISEENLKKIIIKGDTKELVKNAKILGEALAVEGKDSSGSSALTTSQIRNIFGTVKKIENKEFNAEGEREFLLLKPKLAYAAKRAEKTRLPMLKTVLTKSIDLVISDEGNKKEKFRNFCNLFESILCYHKASGGK